MSKEDERKEPPSYVELNELMERDQPRMQEYFNAYIVIGLRKVPEKDRDKHQGAEEVPFWYLYGTPSIAGGLADWAATDIKLRQATAELQQELKNKQTLANLDSETERTEDD